ncbi:MAG: hypothetical protein LBR22_03325 [Desulfovibrio sp.]|jgi:hypothetical protein|nr:hypothetical protein [Desulfovibrio sp.]
MMPEGWNEGRKRPDVMVDVFSLACFLGGLLALITDGPKGVAEGVPSAPVLATMASLVVRLRNGGKIENPYKSA